MHGQTQQSGPVRTEECAIEPVPSNTGYRYRIILRGECGQLLAALFDDAAIESSRDRTCIMEPAILPPLAERPSSPACVVQGCCGSHTPSGHRG